MNTQSPALRHSPDPRLLVWAASGILGIVFVGFARTYFLKFLFDSPPLPWLVHLHGAVMTSWFVLFFAQTCLIARHRVDLHRRLGAVGAALAVVMIVLGIIVVTYAAAREVHAHTKHAPFFLMLLAFDPFVLLVFAALVTGAIAMRNRRGDIHKRLMLLATLSLTPVAIGRLPFPSEGIFWLVYALCLFTPVAVDTVRHHRLHPVLGWGAPSLLASLYVVHRLALAPTWLHFAARLVS
ncbi:MAG TPA: hypothetical protein VGR92_04675 [Steroidobacteraceae bacterium]|nr:hypothetical protein [Steroidobacteraceae bacterium]